MTKRMTEKEKMLAGEVYSAVAPELIEELMATREVLYEYNSLRPSETQRMKEILNPADEGNSEGLAWSCGR